VHLAHPVYVKPFAKKHVKTDKVDARVFLCPKCAEAFKKYAKLAGRGEYEDGNI